MTFQDGSPLTAEAAAGALNHLLSRPVPARAFSSKLVSKVEATGPMTVTVMTTAPDSLLPGRLSSPPTSILSPAAYAGETPDPLGHCTGPFEIKSYEAKTSVNAVAYPGYWGRRTEAGGGSSDLFQTPPRAPPWPAAARRI